MSPNENSLSIPFQNFLRDLLQRAKKPFDEKKLEEYTSTTVEEPQIVTSVIYFNDKVNYFTDSFLNMLSKCPFVLQLKIFDLNHDGKLCLAEMARFVLSFKKPTIFGCLSDQILFQHV